MFWQTIESQGDLDTLNRRVCWEDLETVEYYATPRNEPYFPPDIARSTYHHKNIHILCRLSYPELLYLEMVWIHCDWVEGYFLEHPQLSGRVDRLKRVEILNDWKRTDMRCARLMFRFLPEEEVSLGSFFSQEPRGAWI
jgi:hypothetical protein